MLVVNNMTVLVTPLGEQTNKQIYIPIQLLRLAFFLQVVAMKQSTFLL